MVVGGRGSGRPGHGRGRHPSADPAAHRLDRRHAPEQRAPRWGAIADMGDRPSSWRPSASANETRNRPSAQIDAVALAPALREAEHVVEEEGEARLRLVGQELDMAEMAMSRHGSAVINPVPTAAGCGAADHLRPAVDILAESESSDRLRRPALRLDAEVDQALAYALVGGSACRRASFSAATAAAGVRRVRRRRSRM